MSRSSGGRPRDPRIEAAALAATARLLQSTGAARLTMSAIADEAGTTKAALYRRWPGLVHLVYDTAFPDDLLTAPAMPAEAPLDLRTLVHGTRDAFTRPVVAAALPLLLAEFSAVPALHADLIGRFGAVFEGLDAHLSRGAATGELRCGVRAADLMGAVIGSVLTGLLLAPDDLDDAWADRLTDLLQRGLRP